MITSKGGISLNNHGCKALLFVILLALNSFLFAQSYYSTDPTYLSKRTDKDGALANFNHFYPDTSILKAHQFAERNFLGNLGLSSPDYLLSFKSSKLGFRLFDVPLNDYKIKQEDVEFFKTKGPFAELSGIAGSKQLQLFRMTFSNTFKNNLNITLKLNRYTSQGYYLKQQSFTNNFYLSTNYETKNKRFGFNSYVLVNNNKFQENGGIATDTMREKDLLVTKALIPVKLSSASRDNRELTVNYSNWIRLNKTADNNISTYLNIGSAYSSLKYKYKDPDSDLNSYYFLYYLDTTQTLDSTHIRKLNSIADLCFQTKNKNLNWSFGYENELTQHWQYSDTSLMNHLLNVKLNYNRSFNGFDSSNHTDLLNQVTINYIAAGAFSGNYKLESAHQLRFYRNNKLKENLSLKLLAEDRTPDYIYKHWYSNHFIWNNTFNNTQTIQAELNARTSMFGISAIYKGITNYLYFDQLGYPMQYTGNISNTSVKLNFEHVFFKHLGIRVDQSFQNTSSNLISLPKSVSLASLFYKGNWFKNNLQICFGGQVEYYDQFTPYAYMPATQVFHIQEEYQAGNFAFVDVFLNARIKPVTFFFKMENVLHGMLGTNYSMVPGYYQPERALRFGLTWLFFD